MIGTDIVYIIKYTLFIVLLYIVAKQYRRMSRFYVCHSLFGMSQFQPYLTLNYYMLLLPFLT